MSETSIDCPMRRCGGQRSGQNHDASARTATRAETPGRVGWRRAWASPSSGEHALRSGMLCARVRAAFACCKDRTLQRLSP
jgi:hypothetical protein